jgi:hypothetical protein
MANPRTYRAAGTPPVAQQTPQTDQAETEEQSTPPPAVDPATVVWAGLNAAEAIAEVLGPRADRRTGDPEADCVAAIRELARYGKESDLWRRLILHVLHDLYVPENRDVWLRVAERVGHTKSTTWAWAHRGSDGDQ